MMELKMIKAVKILADQQEKDGIVKIQKALISLQFALLNVETEQWCQIMNVMMETDMIKKDVMKIAQDL